MTHSSSIRVPDIIAAKGERKITCLTAYDFTMARLIDSAGVDCILVGDSLASVVQGEETTLPVTLEQMVYHSRCVVKAAQRALVVADLPFLSYQVSPEQALETAGRLLKEAGVAAVKLEGGVHMAQTIERLVQVDIPVMGHVGLTPQSYHRMGGHRLQGKKSRSESVHAAGTREQVLADAKAVAAAGAFAIVLEGVPKDLAAEITASIAVPTIGIGAGVHCDGQILVSTDMLGLNGAAVPSFVKRYADLAGEVKDAVATYIFEVGSQEFPESKTKPTTLKALN